MCFSCYLSISLFGRVEECDATRHYCFCYNPATINDLINPLASYHRAFREEAIQEEGDQHHFTDETLGLKERDDLDENDNNLKAKGRIVY